MCVCQRAALPGKKATVQHKEDDTRLGHLIVKGSTHMFDKMHLCFDGTSPRVNVKVKEQVRAELTRRGWAGGCRRAWIAAVVFK